MGRDRGGIALVGKRAFYVELMKTGLSNAEACRRVGVNRKTGVRWQHGRRAKYRDRAYVYAPINVEIAAKKPESGRYLSQRERIVIADAARAGLSGRKIAALLPGRAVSTICRELARNAETGGGYQPFIAQNKMMERRPRPKAHKLADTVVNFEVQALLDKQWSPEQISAVLAKRGDGPRISVESIYRGIYNPLIPLRRELALRTRRLQRRKRRAVGERQQRFTTPMRPLTERPAGAADRSEAGHWEGDLIIGEFNGSAIGTLVERVTRYTMVVHLDGARTADQVKAAITARFNEVPVHLRLSLTWDQGIEMARHHEFTEETGVPGFFCEPRSPWQRPSNENTNGLLRGYFPKSTDLYQHSPERLAEVEKELNERPRKTLGWDSPQQRFDTLKIQAV